MKTYIADLGNTTYQARNTSMVAAAKKIAQKITAHGHPTETTFKVIDTDNLGKVGTFFYTNRNGNANRV